MRIAIVGSGAQGTGLAGLLVKEEDVTEVLLIDYDERALTAATELVGSTCSPDRVRSAQADASDPAQLSLVAAGADVVFNATIPAFNVAIMHAALELGAHYLDLFANPFEGVGVPRSHTIDGQFDLHQQFVAAGLTALPSVGVTPGWTSLAAQEAIDELDTVEQVVVRFLDWVDTDELFLPVSPGVVMHEWLGAPHPAAVEDGVIVPVDLLGSEEDFDFGPLIGTRPVYTVTAHPDIVLIPRFAGKPIARCEEKFGIQIGKHGTLAVLVKALQRVSSRQGDDRSAINVVEAMAKEFTAPSDFDALLADGRIRDAAVVFTTEVAGYRGDRFERHISSYTATLDTARKHLPWASPAVYGTVGGMPIELVLSLGRGEIDMPGVLSVAQLGLAAELTERMVARDQLIEKRVIS